MEFRNPGPNTLLMKPVAKGGYLEEVDAAILSLSRSMDIDACSKAPVADTQVVQDFLEPSENETKRPLQTAELEEAEL